MRTLAYLDAGTGSMIVQAAVAGVAGVAVVAKVGLRRMTGTFRKAAPPSDVQSAEVPQPEAVDTVDSVDAS
jgi:hypothetical protein